MMIPSQPTINLSDKCIPSELRALRQWVLHKSKVPHQTTNKHASPTNPNHWATFDQVRCEYELIGGFDGIGFVFSSTDPYCGIDLDHCVSSETKVIEPWALRWVEKFNKSYVEYSPSGTGIHIFTRGALPGGQGRKIGPREIYDRSRYFTVTGNSLRQPLKEIKNQQDVIDEFLAEIFSGAGEDTSLIDLKNPLQGSELSDNQIQEIIAKAKTSKNGDKFSRLFAGDVTDFKGDHSRADSSLCEILAFWTDGNEIAIDQALRKSGLYRPKWERLDYRTRTIRHAIEHLNKSKLKNDFHATTPKTEGTEALPLPLIHISKIEPKSIEFLIEDILPLNAVGFISGQPGICKTWLAWDIGLSVATGSIAFGSFRSRAGKVIAFNAEDDPASNTRRRLAGLAHSKGLSLQEADFHLIDVFSLALDDAKIQEQIEQTVTEHKPDLIILDPFRNLHSQDENDSTKISPILNFLRSLNRRHHCSILLVCHDKKPSKQNGARRASQTRGSNALEGWRDTAMYLDEIDSIEKIVEVTFYHRGAPAPKPIRLRLSVDFEPDNKTIRSASLIKTDFQESVAKEELEFENKIKAMLLDFGPLTRKEIVQRLGKQKKRVEDGISDLLLSGELMEIAPRPGAKAKLIKFQFPEPQGTGTSMISSGSTPYKGGTENPLDQPDQTR